MLTYLPAKQATRGLHTPWGAGWIGYFGSRLS